MDVKWYSDQSAKAAYGQSRTKLDPLIVELFPEYLLSHFGINRNYDTEEVIIKLHLNKLGRVTVVTEDPSSEDYKLLK